MIPTTVIGVFQAEIVGQCGSSLQDFATRGPLIQFAPTIYPSDNCAYHIPHAAVQERMPRYSI